MDKIFILLLISTKEPNKKNLLTVRGTVVTICTTY